MYTYIDDMMTAPRQKNEFQTAFHKLTKPVEQNNYRLHKEKAQYKTTNHFEIITMPFLRRRSHGRGFDITSMRAINMKWSALFKNFSISIQPHWPNLHIVHKASMAILVMHNIQNINMVLYRTAIKFFGANIT
jgi:hypothetical protein